MTTPASTSAWQFEQSRPTAAIRLEAVLAQPVADRGGMAPEAPADLLQREIRIKKPLKASSVHTKSLSEKPDG